MRDLLHGAARVSEQLLRRVTLGWCEFAAHVLRFTFSHPNYAAIGWIRKGCYRSGTVTRLARRKAGDKLWRFLMEPWRTAIVDAKEGQIRLRGYDVTALMARGSFTDTVFLLHRGRLPSAAERRLLDAILTGGADHGAGAPSCAASRLAASGNRESLSAAVAAGVLAIGDNHGGAGMGCMEMIAAGVTRAEAEKVTIADAARTMVREARAAGRRLPGFGHRVHKHDPRTDVLFGLAREGGIAGSGVEFVEAAERAISEEVKPLPINIDGALAAVLHDMGFDPIFGRLVFIIARVAGLTAEVAEELAREKPMRIKIPVEYDGVPQRTME
jgi:citrate synthase